MISVVNTHNYMASVIGLWTSKSRSEYRTVIDISTPNIFLHDCPHSHFASKYFVPTWSNS